MFKGIRGVVALTGAASVVAIAQRSYTASSNSLVDGQLAAAGRSE